MNKNNSDTDFPMRIDLEQLDRYASNCSTADEATVVEAVLLNSNDHIRLLQEMKRITAGGKNISRAADVEAGWNMVRSGIKQPAPLRSGTYNFTSSLSRYLRSLAVICGVFLGLLIGNSTADLDRMEAGAVTYTTGAGKRTALALGDGTEISLNSESRLQLPANYGASYKTVQLEGHAYFRVVSQQNSPYVVIAEGVNTRVLGTEFSVKAYKNSETRVSVMSGRVSVNDTIVSANQYAYLDSIGRIMVRNKIDKVNDFAFVSGKLVLNDVKLRDAVDDMNRWYGTDIRFSDIDIENYHIRGSFSSGTALSLKEILETMFDINAEIKGRTLTLSLR